MQAKSRRQARHQFVNVPRLSNNFLPDTQTARETSTETPRCRTACTRAVSKAASVARCSHTYTCAYTYVSIRQHTSAYIYVYIRIHTSAYVSIRQHTSSFKSSFPGDVLVYIRTLTCEDVRRRMLTYADVC
jgi:hypothetical protein